jgi:hypothetical protein
MKIEEGGNAVIEVKEFKEEEEEAFPFPFPFPFPIAKPYP